MKKILLFILFSMFACLTFSQKAYKLTGEFEDDSNNGKHVHLQIIDSNYNFKTISSALVENREFVFEGKVQSAPAFGMVNDIPFILEEGNTKVKFSNHPALKVSGTHMNNTYQYFTDQFNKQWGEIVNLKSDYEQQKEEKGFDKNQYIEFKKNLFLMKKALSTLLFDYLKPNMNNYVGAPLFENYMVYFIECESEGQLLELLSSAPQNFKNRKRVRSYERAANNRLKTQVGTSFIDVNGVTLDEKTVSLSDYVKKNKITLLDFWASWCGACIDGLPDLQKIYAEYKDKGFGIVSVSLDEDKKTWERSTLKYNLEWGQFSNLKGWEEPAGKAYGVVMIPYMILIDESGVIISKNISSEDLRIKLDEFLN